MQSRGLGVGRQAGPWDRLRWVSKSQTQEGTFREVKKVISRQTSSKTDTDFAINQGGAGESGREILLFSPKSGRKR